MRSLALAFFLVASPPEVRLCAALVRVTWALQVVSLTQIVASPGHGWQSGWSIGRLGLSGQRGFGLIVKVEAQALFVWSPRLVWTITDTVYVPSLSSVCCNDVLVAVVLTRLRSTSVPAEFLMMKV